jgi:tetratricopeptide (TPR) repeat protein
MSRALTPFYLTAFLLVPLSTSPLFALPVARLRSIKPVVEIGDKKNAFRVAKHRNALVFGDTVRTGVGGKADILFNNGTQVALRERTQVQLIAPASEGKPLVLRVFGSLSEVFIRAKGPTEIRTAAGTAAVRGTEFLVQLNAEDKTTLIVTEGSVNFANPLGEVLVKANQQSSATTTSAPTAPILIDASGLLAWTLDITQLSASGLTADETEALQLLQANNAKEARTVLTRGGAATTANTSAISSLIYLVEGNTRRARNEAKKAVELDPLSPFALFALGRSELGRGDLDEARQAFSQAAVLAPQNPLFLNEAGAIYARLDQLPRAEQAYNAALAINPNDAIALAGLGTVQGDRGDNTNARKNLERAVELAPQNASVRAQYANFLVKQGDLKKAAAIGRELLAQRGDASNPELGALYIRLSESALFRQKLNESLEYAKLAVKVLPNSAPANYQLGRVYLEQGRSIPAQNQFRYATILDPDFHSARYALGLVQDQIAMGRNGHSALGSATSNDVSSQGSLLSIERSRQPGANQRLQALVSDPTVTRTASRSFGDLQIDATGGSEGYLNGSVSYIKEGKDGRSVTAVSGDYTSVDGIRPAADTDSDLVVASYGEKDKDSPSGAFVHFQNRRTHLPSDDGPTSDPTFANQILKDKEPLFLAGINWQKSQNRQARVLLQAGQFKSKRTNTITGDDNINEDNGSYKDRIYAGEFRYDWRYATDHRLIFGLGHRLVDRDEYSSNIFDFPDFGFYFGDKLTNKGSLRTTTAYIRDSWQLTPRLNLDSELKYRRSDDSTVRRLWTDFDGEVLPPEITRAGSKSSHFTPTFLLKYQANRNSQLRLRYSQKTAFTGSPDTLAPDDVFLYSQDAIPTLTGRENRTDLELTRNLGSDNLLYLGAFYVRQTRASGGFGIKDADFLGVRSSLTGLLSRNISYSLIGEANFAKGEAFGVSDYLSRDHIARIPRYRAELGLQYLADSGFFIQPSVAYIGASPEGASTPDNRFRSEGGYALANLRVGKRYGLKYAAFAEVINIFDKEYSRLYSTTFNTAGIPRQYRVGISTRF